MARRGARTLTPSPGAGPDGAKGGPSASELWRQAVDRAEADRREAAGERWTPDEVWIQDEEIDEPEAPVRRTPPQHRDIATGREGIPTPGGRRRKVPRPVIDELAAAAGPERSTTLANRISDAAYAYEKERYHDARRILKTLADQVPGSPTVRELYGLVLYRLGQWAAAAKQLEAFRQMTGSFDQNPVLADCYRALKRFDDAEQVWIELRDASPSGDIVTEGRIVAAGCLADQGDLREAISVLERAARRVRKPEDRHLRQWYALADLYERAGDLPRARDLFERVAGADPEAFDVGSRLRSLR